ncbi:MAG: UDP-glucose 4-epimerase GalE [Nanobdellota archaeon]
METVLVTGGAGYIGSVAVDFLIKEGYNVVVIDNLSKGRPELVNEQAVLYAIDLVDKKRLGDVFSENNISYVIHIAAYKAVDESMNNAVKYSDNIQGTINLLNKMVEHNVKKIIYSSSAAVYGIPEESVVSEDSFTRPINFYGFTKLECENLIDWYSKTHGINYISLRYFNVAGDVLGYIDPDAQNVLPILMEVVTGKRDRFIVFGNDYDTKDGTCVRDYIHIKDLVNAHIKALDSDRNSVINLGTAKGTSVEELLQVCEKETGQSIKREYGKRREGDPGFLVASNNLANKLLGWIPEEDINSIVRTTYEAYKDGKL